MVSKSDFNKLNKYYKTSWKQAKQDYQKTKNMKNVAIHDIYPETETMEIVEKHGSFVFAPQKIVVNDEKHMISDETNIPASLINKVKKGVTKLKEVLHKNAPTAITTTKKSELESRTIVKPVGIGIVIIVVIIYLLIRGR